jgi:hypothetical protein
LWTSTIHNGSSAAISRPRAAMERVISASEAPSRFRRCTEMKSE